MVSVPGRRDWLCPWEEGPARLPRTGLYVAYAPGTVWRVEMSGLALARHERWLVALLLIVCAACSRKTDVSGDVYVIMKSGDVKRGAGVEVVMVAASPDFEKEWAAEIERFKADVAPPVDEYIRWKGHQTPDWTHYGTFCASGSSTSCPRLS
jgi:hypothetical protein